MRSKVISVIEFVAVWSYLIGAIWVVMETR